ncbi:MAG: PAS domain-containing protein, partial [Acidobacteria bacterium]|nr:PAS domain-containing protein [Acidobacteriota bacterium]
MIKERLDSILGSLDEVVWSLSPKSYELLYLNPAAERLYGRKVADYFADKDLWLQSIHPEDRERMVSALSALLTHGILELEYRIVRPDGEVRWVRDRGRVIPGDCGEIVRLGGVVTDITDQKYAQELESRAREELEARVEQRTAELAEANKALRAEIAERKHMEEALRQVQKMEAVGQLTGGVAHDFNNLLTVIQGNLQMLEARLKDDPALHKLVLSAAKGAQRGVELIRKLLAFSRRQPLQPKALDLPQILAGMMELLHRTLGEHIAIEILQPPGLWPALADPAQVETAILNLALNARDAMPDGGRLIFEAANVTLEAVDAAQEPYVILGDYVMLTVSDTGTGMPPEVVSRAFEPFFTTKPAGRGSGLGLSMVYGFAKQSGGHVAITSEIGHGTTVRIYLPRAKGAAPGAEKPRSPASGHRGGGEALLVVEDDGAVREIAVTFLTELGYRVQEAKDGPAALALLEQGLGMDLLFTDLVLPGGMSGAELAREVKQRYPAIKVLYTSGYPRNVLLHEGRLDEGVYLLVKPYSQEDLARQVREVLNGEGDQSGDPE